MSKLNHIQREALVKTAWTYNFNVAETLNFAKVHGIRFIHRAITFSTSKNQNDAIAGNEKLHLSNKLIAKLEKLSPDEQRKEKLRFIESLKSIGFLVREWPEDYVDEISGAVRTNPRYSFLYLEKWSPDKLLTNQPDQKN